jgi:hypothetical protein
LGAIFLPFHTEKGIKIENGYRRSGEAEIHICIYVGKQIEKIQNANSALQGVTCLLSNNRQHKRRILWDELFVTGFSETRLLGQDICATV